MSGTKTYSEDLEPEELDLFVHNILKMWGFLVVGEGK